MPYSMPIWAAADEGYDARQQHGMHGAFSGKVAVSAGDLHGDVAAGGGADEAGGALGIVERHRETRLRDGFIGGGGREPAIAARMHDGLVAAPLG